MTSVEQLLNSGIAALKSNNPGSAVVAAKQLAQRTSVSEDPEVVEIGNQLSAVADLVAAKVGPPKPSSSGLPPSPNLATLKKNVTDIFSVGVSALPQQPKNDTRLKEWRQLQTLYDEAKAAEAATAPKTVTQGRNPSMNTAFVSAYRAYMDAKGKYLTKYAGLPNVGSGPVDEFNPFTEEGKAAIAINEAEQTAVAARRTQEATRIKQDTDRQLKELANRTVAEEQGEEARLAGVLRAQEAERRKPFEEARTREADEKAAREELETKLDELEQRAKSQGFNSAKEKKEVLELLRLVREEVNKESRIDWADLIEPIVEMGPLFKRKGTRLEEDYNQLKRYVFEKQLLKQQFYDEAEQNRATRRLANIRQGTEIRQSAPAFPRRAGANFAKNAANLATLTQRQPLVVEGEGRAPVQQPAPAPMVQQSAPAPAPAPAVNTRSKLQRMRNAIASASAPVPAPAPANTNTLVRPTNVPPEANTSALFGAPRPSYSPAGLPNTGNANIFQRERGRDPNMNQRPLGSTAPSQQSLWATPNRNTGVGALSPSTGRAISSYLGKKRGGTRRRHRKAKQTRKIF